MSTAADWSSMCERWHALGLKHYEPLSEDRCNEIMHDAQEAIKAFKLPAGTEDTTTNSFGWRDSVHLDADSLYVHFQIRKTLESADMKQVVDHKWSLYTDGDLFKKAHLGDSCDFFHQTLQKISPDLLVIQRIEKYANSEELTHSLALVFRAMTETGYMLVFRSIESPQLQSLLKADGLTLCGTFTWDTFEAVHQDGQGESGSVLFTTTGSIGSDNSAYAKRWRDNLVNTLVLYETDLKETTLVSNEVVTGEVSDETNNSGWRMRTSAQPAQSPDLNVLDLGFFNSIQSLQDQTTPQTEEELIAEVKRAYWASSPVTLNKTFLTLQFMMEHIMKHDGKNDFRLGHLRKKALLRINELPVFLQCDRDTYTAA